MPTTKEIQEALADAGSTRGAAAVLGMAESTLRGWIKREGIQPSLPAHAFVPDASQLAATHVDDTGVDTQDFWAEQESQETPVRRYILTSAQNNCRVHEGFLANLKALGNVLDAKLLVSFTVYDRAGYKGLVRKGDASMAKQDVWWDRAIQPFAVNDRCRLHKRLAFCGELDILATAKRPLSGLDAYCGRSSIIVPHNRFSFKCVESRKHQMPKEMLTTGSVTRSKFIQRKTGQLAHFHHVVGALLVEVTREGFWYVHHLNAEEDGSFYWLDKRVRDGEVLKNKVGLDALVLGDIHHEKLDLDQSDTAMQIVGKFQPRNILIHDIIDFTSRNHHNREDPLFKVSQRGVTVRTELRQAALWLQGLMETARGDVVVVKSNHDSALGKWVREADWKMDPDNAEFYLKLAHLMVMHRNQSVSFDPLAWAIKDLASRDMRAVRFLRLDESYEVDGIECGIHGHIGPSGAFGSPAGYSRLGFKTFTAHTHTPSIVDGCYTVGVMGKLEMGYNVGPSKWMHTHGIIYPNGKRAFLTVKNGLWRAPE